MSAPGISVQSWGNISATPSNFSLPGGRYRLAAIAGEWGTVTLHALGPDGSTLLPVPSGNLAANGMVVVEVGKGEVCQLTLGTGTTGVYASIAQVPLAPTA